MDRENAAGLCKIPPHALQHPQDDLSLELVRGLVEREGLGRADLRGLLGQQYVEWQIVQLNDGPVRQHHASLDDILELAHVPRPPIGLERGERLGREPLDALVEVTIVTADEVLGQERDVLSPLPKRRRDDGYHVEAVIEVFPEGAVADGRFEVGVRGGDDADVDPDRPRAAHPFDLALLEHPQELRLELRPERADLVEKQGAALRQLELSELPLMGAGERTPLVTEELGLDERLYDGGRIDGDERPLAPRPLAVDGPRDQFLACAALGPPAR
jgi:hypothetical protein